MDSDGVGARPEMETVPQTLHSAFTPEGQIEQAALLAAGLRAERHGWRRVVVWTGFILIAAALLITLGFAVYYRG